MGQGGDEDDGRTVCDQIGFEQCRGESHRRVEVYGDQLFVIFYAYVGESPHGVDARVVYQYVNGFSLEFGENTGDARFRAQVGDDKSRIQFSFDFRRARGVHIHACDGISRLCEAMGKCVADSSRRACNDRVFHLVLRRIMALTMPSQ